jgi:phosphotransferase system enzyme I (PtsI)
VEERRLQDLRGVPAVTRDESAVRLLANVEFASEAATAVLYGAQGIGLFRSEYLLGRKRSWPGEEQQVDVYRRLLEQLRPHPVTVRTWDVEPEDVAPGGPSSPNPALGERALRLVRRYRQPFLEQLRALLRAAAHGPLRVSFPFIGGPADLQLALELLDEARAGLEREGLAFRADVPIGINLEIPSAAITADLLVKRVDFLSVGTNDLIQYLLAVDRVDPRVAALFQPLHPAVIRTLAQLVTVAEAGGVPLSICGEMAADPLHALFLVGLGVRELSMSPSAIPRVKEALRRVTLEELRAAAESCRELETAEAVEARLRERLAPGPAPVVESGGRP